MPASPMAAYELMAWEPVPGKTVSATTGIHCREKDNVLSEAQCRQGGGGFPRSRTSLGWMMGRRAWFWARVCCGSLGDVPC